MLNRQFFIYICRWIISGVVMTPFMKVFECVFGNGYLFCNIIIGQIIGAFIFWKIDKSIFKKQT